MFLYLILIPVSYLVVSLMLTAITVHHDKPGSTTDKSIFLITNGVHLDIVIPKEDVDSLLLTGLKHRDDEKYLAFGWGDENFYVNTPTWRELTFKNAFSAVFLKGPSLIHLTRYQKEEPDWIEIKVEESELSRLNNYLNASFALDENEEKQLLENKGYTAYDDFYRARGSYSCFKTCNSWVNSAFKESGLKCCYWTPFDFGLMNKYNNGIR